MNYMQSRRSENATTFTVDSDFLRLVMYLNPNAGDTNIRLGLFDIDTGELKRADGKGLDTTAVGQDLFPIILINEAGRKCAYWTWQLLKVPAPF